MARRRTKKPTVFEQVLRIGLIVAITLFVSSGVTLLSDAFTDARIFLYSSVFLILAIIIGMATGDADLSPLQRLGFFR